MSERHVHLPPGVELTPQQIRVDEVLQEYYVKDELRKTRFVACQSRTSSRDEYLARPPRFRFLTEYHASIYDPIKHLVYEGKWSDFHNWIARDNGISKPEDSWKGIQRYVSADVFVLRACQGVRVIILNTLLGLERKDINTLKNLKYVVLSPDYNWVLEYGENSDGYIEIPSALSMKTR